MRVGWGLLTCTHLCCKGFCSRIAKGGDCECLARLAILDKILKCPLTRLSNSYSDYLTLKTKTLLRGSVCGRVCGE